jgi:hypothetical protein
MLEYSNSPTRSKARQWPKGEHCLGASSKSYVSQLGNKTSNAAVRFGHYVMVVVDSVPPAQLQLLQQKFVTGALVLHGLLRHENRISVVNFCLKRAGAAGDVVRSKEPLLFLIGSR